MLRRLNRGWVWLLLPISAIVFFLGASVYFYRGPSSTPPDLELPLQPVGLPSYSASDTDDGERVTRPGVLLIDNAHDNKFQEGELSTLISKVVDRGHSVDFVIRNGLVWWIFTREQRLAFLEEQLRRADSFVSVMPNILYSSEESEMLERFVRKGGRVLLIADPDRTHRTNRLAERFGLTFQVGYLYNVSEHLLNFRNILVRGFRPDEVTEGLSEIALYTAGNIQSNGTPLAFTDANTLSSAEERLEPFTPVAKSADGRVLAIADLTFLQPPQSSSADNSRFISNIADFLTSAEREFDLADFPHLFKGDVDILLGRPALFDTGARLRSALSDAQILAEFRGVEDLNGDTVFLGLYQDSLAVAAYLDVAGVQVGDTIRTPFTPDIAAEGTAVLILHQGIGRRVLIVLADGPETLGSMVGRLESGTFREGLVGDSLGVYRLQ